MDEPADTIFACRFFALMLSSKHCIKFLYEHGVDATETTGLLFDYYLKKSRRHCAAMAPDLFHKCQKNCVNPLKSLRLSDFPFDGLITPTLKAAGSSPVGRTKTAENFMFSVVLHLGGLL